MATSTAISMPVSPRLDIYSSGPVPGLSQTPGELRRTSKALDAVVAFLEEYSCYVARFYM